jgi:hypothetical protein
MTQGRPPFRFALIDLPSDHEIDGGLVTECQVINTILHNRNIGGRTKTFRATSKENFLTPPRPYNDLGFVHLAAHGSKTGIGLIGGSMPWRDVANKIKAIAPALKPGKQRVLILSCCYSRDGYTALKPLFKGHFTGFYYFESEVIDFATAMTVWSMFYRKKSIKKPASAVVEVINKFFDEKVIVYNSA